MPKRVVSIQYTRAFIQPETLDPKTREVDVVFVTETPIPQSGEEFGEPYDEILVCEPSAVRMDRIDKGLPVLDCHREFSVFNQIGRTIDVWFSESREMWARIRFSSRADISDLLQDIADGIVKDVSVGYDVHKYQREDRGPSLRPIYRAIDWTPAEISFAPVPADVNSGVRSKGQTHEVDIIHKPINQKRTMKKRTNGEIKQYTVTGEAVKQGDVVDVDGNGTMGVALSDGDVDETIDVSLVPATPTEEIIEQVTEVVTEEIAPDADPETVEEIVTETVEEIVAETSADRKRLNQILKSTRAAKLPYAFAIQLFNSNKSVTECQDAIIAKAAAGQRSVTGAHGLQVGLTGTDKKRKAIEGVLLHRAYPSKFELEQGAREYRGMSMVDLTKELFAERGMNVRNMSKMDVAEYAFGKKRMHSTSDLPVIMGNVVNRMLLAQYEFAPEFWDMISRPTTVNDFREQELLLFGTKNGMREIPEGGNIKYTTMEESGSRIRVKSYGEGLIYTFQMFINDDLSVLANIPSNFVRDWDEMRGDVIWGLITGNVKMGDGKELFHTDHGNLIPGATSKLQESSLAAAKMALSKQKGIDNRRLRYLAKYLIVPPELEVDARKLITEITATKTSDVNVFANQFNIIVEPRLEDPTAWYLSADPHAAHTLVHAHLDGFDHLRSNMEENFDSDSMKFAVRGQFGAAAVDYRGLVKAKGKA